MLNIQGNLQKCFFKSTSLSTLKYSGTFTITADMIMPLCLFTEHRSIPRINASEHFSMQAGHNELSWSILKRQ